MVLVRHPLALALAHCVASPGIRLRSGQTRSRICPWLCVGLIAQPVNAFRLLQSSGLQPQAFPDRLAPLALAGLVRRLVPDPAAVRRSLPVPDWRRQSGPAVAVGRRRTLLPRRRSGPRRPPRLGRNRLLKGAGQ